MIMMSFGAQPALKAIVAEVPFVCTCAPRTNPTVPGCCVGVGEGEGVGVGVGVGVAVETLNNTPAQKCAWASGEYVHVPSIDPVELKTPLAVSAQIKRPELVPFPVVPKVTLGELV